MKIEVGKTYITSTGLMVEVLCTDLFGSRPVLATYVKGGEKRTIRYSIDGDDVGSLYPEIYGNIIREAGPYDDFKIGDKIMVRNSERSSWGRRYFAGVRFDGKPMAFPSGADIWTSEPNDLSSWEEARAPTPEEDAYRSMK